MLLRRLVMANLSRTNMEKLRYFLLVLFLFFPAASASAQTDRSPLFSCSPLRVDVDLVNLTFNVFDKNQRHVENLQKRDLILYEDEVQQEISLLGKESSLLSVVLLLDVSGSLAPFAQQAESLYRLLPAVFESGDEMAVIAFSESPQILQDFTLEKKKIRIALERPSLTHETATGRDEFRYFEGATNISDSVYLASRKLEASGPGKRRVIVLISDGIGNRGDSTRAYDELKTSGATLVRIGLGLTTKLRRYSMLINRWIKDTGGASLLFSSEIELRNSIQSALCKIRSEYGIAYSPSNRKKDGKFRRIRMEVSRDSPYALRSLTIRGPQGYFAPIEITRHQ